MESLGFQEREDVVQRLCHATLSTPHSPSFDSYLRYYTSTCLAKTVKVPFYAPEKAALRCHEDVLHSVDVLRQSPRMMRRGFESRAFGESSQVEQEHACRVCVKVSFMIDCSSKNDYSEGYRLSDEFPVKWRGDQSFVDFLEEIFPTKLEPEEGDRKDSKPLKAWKLKKRYGVRFVPTNDLVQHLMYDPEARTIKIFHQIAWLKGHLRHSAGLALMTSFETSVNQCVSLLLVSFSQLEATIAC